MELENINYLAASVQDSVQCIVDQFKVDYCTLHLFRGGDDARNHPYVRTTYPDAWVSHYLLNDYVRLDPVLQRARTTTGPFCWSTITLEADHLNMMEQAMKHGLGRTGFSISHVDSLDRLSVLSCNAHEAPDGKTWRPFLETHRDHLVRLAFEMHQKALSELPGDSDAVPQLSPRETECLKWTAQGKAHTEIAVILNPTLGLQAAHQ